MNKYIHDRLPVFTFIIIIFILGISFGAIAVKTVDYSVKENVFNYFNDFLNGYNQLEYKQNSLIAESIRFNLLNIFIIWAFGLSMVLMPLITILVFFKGFVLGFTVGFLVSEYSYKGILISLAAVFPQNVIIIPTYIISSVLAIYISIRIFRYYRRNIKIKSEEILRYSAEMAVLAIVLLFAAVIETYVSPLILKFMLKFI